MFKTRSDTLVTSSFLLLLVRHLLLVAMHLLLVLTAKIQQQDFGSFDCCVNIEIRCFLRNPPESSRRSTLSKKQTWTSLPLVDARPTRTSFFAFSFSKKNRRFELFRICSSKFPPLSFFPVLPDFFSGKIFFHKSVGNTVIFLASPRVNLAMLSPQPSTTRWRASTRCQPMWGVRITFSNSLKTSLDLRSSWICLVSRFGLKWGSLVWHHRLDQRKQHYKSSNHATLSAFSCVQNTAAVGDFVRRTHSRGQYPGQPSSLHYKPLPFSPCCPTEHRTMGCCLARAVEVLILHRRRPAQHQRSSSFGGRRSEHPGERLTSNGLHGWLNGLLTLDACGVRRCSSNM